jgi:hypothetical protein
MIKTVFTLLIVLGLAASAAAQKNGKPWTEWSAKDAEKVLTDSAWGQTQTELGETEAAGSAVTKTSSTRDSGQIINDQTSKGMDSGATIGKKNTAPALRYRVSFLSAKPIRQAFIRIIELQQQVADPEKIAQLRTFVDRDFGDLIVVTLILDGTDNKRLGPATQEIAAADEATLQKSVYLERKDGKRVPLKNYRAPGTDGLGAKFVFPRTVEGKPFIEATSGEVRFVAEMGKIVKLNRRFKVADMIYDEKLEY